MRKFNWAKKVPQQLIAELYLSDSQRLCDEELQNEVGYALYARCQSIVAVTNGFEKKQLPCPECSRNIPLIDGVFACSCGFSATWDEFRASYKNKQLYGANAMPVFIKFIHDFENSKNYTSKSIAIDTLIHSFHVLHSCRTNYVNFNPEDESVALGRPVGTNLIEGSLGEVITFLDNLSNSAEKLKWQAIVKRANGGNWATRGCEGNEENAGCECEDTMGANVAPKPPRCN